MLQQVGKHLVLLALLLALALGRLGADLLVVLLEGGKVLAGLQRERGVRRQRRWAVEVAISASEGRREAGGRLTSENSPSSMPSPTYQCTKARLAYIRSNLWSMREKSSAIAVEFDIMATARITLARSPPGTTVGGW